MNTAQEPAPTTDRYRVLAAICEPRAEIFGTGAPFVSGWATARGASLQLADHLERAGLAQQFGGLRADTSVSGQGLVCLGSVDPRTVRALAMLINRGLCAEMDAAYAA